MNKFLGMLTLLSLVGAANAYAWSNYDWRQNSFGQVYCAEVTPYGDVIRTVSSDNCRNSVGSRPEWKQNSFGQVYCAEVTPRGSEIRSISNDECRQAVGSSYEWKKNSFGQVYCAEVTPRGNEIRSVSSDTCRNAIPNGPRMGVVMRIQLDRFGNQVCLEFDLRTRRTRILPLNLCLQPDNSGWGNVGSSFSWKQNSFGQVYCAEVTPSGDEIRSVSTDSCRQAVGSYSDWKKNSFGQVYCAEVTPRGNEIRSQSTDVCRSEVGSTFEWNKNSFGQVYCAEVTLYQRWEIRSVGNDYCR